MSWNATCDYELTEQLDEEANAAIVYSYRKGVWSDAWAIPIGAILFSLTALFMGNFADNLATSVAVICGIIAVVCIVFIPCGLYIIFTKKPKLEECRGYGDAQKHLPLRMRIEIDGDGITIEHGPAGCDDSELERAQTTWKEWSGTIETDTLIIIKGKTDMNAFRELEAEMKLNGAVQPFGTEGPVTKTTKSFYGNNRLDARLNQNELETLQCTTYLVLPKACVQGMSTNKLVRKIQRLTTSETTN